MQRFPLPKGSNTVLIRIVSLPNYEVHCQSDYERFTLKQEGAEWSKEFPCLVHALEHAKAKGARAFTVFNPDGKVIIQSGKKP